MRVTRRSPDVAAVGAEGDVPTDTTVVRRSSALGGLMLAGGAGLLLAILTWSLTPNELEPTDVIDFDYRGALEWAAVHHVGFGGHLVFTYGPLGFLAWPTLFFAAPAALGFVFLTVLQAAVGAVVFRYFKAACSLGVAALLSYVVVVLTSFGFAVDIVVPLTLVWATSLVERDLSDRTSLQWVMAGSLTAIAGLIKVSMGPPVLLIFLLAWLLGRRRRLSDGLGFLAGLLGAFLVVWLATGNSVTSIVTWVKLSVGFITGYSAMAYETNGRRYFYWLAGVGIVAVLAVAVHHGVRDGGGRWRTLGWVLMAAVGMESAFREAFVRHDAHDVLFFAELPLFLIAMSAVPSRRALTFQPSLVLTAAVLELVVIGTVPAVVARPFTGAHNWLSTGKAIFLGSERARLETSARDHLQSIYRLPEAWLAELRGQPVAVVPRGQPMAWTYPQLRWDPLPTIQEYTAYTPSLDQLDARFLTSASAPRYVLQQSFGLDNRFPAWDSPDAELALRCWYRPAGTSAYLTLLVRTADQCGPERPLGIARTALGATIVPPEPEPGAALVATVQIGPSLLGRVAGLLFKGATYSVVINGTADYRYVAGTGSSPHLLRFPRDAGSTMAVPAVMSLRFVSNDPWASNSTVTLHFSEIPLH